MNRRLVLRRAGAAIAGATAISSLEQHATAQHAAPRTPAVSKDQPRASDGSPLDVVTAEMRPVIERYEVELRDLNRVYALPGSALRLTKLQKFYREQLAFLEKLSFETFSQSGKVDYLLLRARLLREQKQLTDEAALDAEIEPLIPFAKTIIGLEESRRRMDTVEAQGCAAALAKMNAEIAVARAAATPKLSSQALNRAAVRLAQLRTSLRSWFNFYDLYDPRFSWWVDAELKKADESLDAYAQALHVSSGVLGPLEAGTGFGGRGGGRGGRGDGAPAESRGRGAGAATRKAPLGSEEELAGVGPAGNEALVEALRTAMIPYSAAELISLANREFAWCDREMLRASGELGFGNDWRKALDLVKNKYVEPGQMIYLVRDLAREAVEYLEKHELVTLPPLLKEDYWEEALTPQQQLTSPFFLGGAVIQVSSPASSMTFQERIESMRGNNIYFARATVFHELIPGHHMQQYMTQRYRAYRGLFSTPFWTEGMAFYWEMLLWDLGFTHTPEQRIGALVWRMHRCARIIFSLSFHLRRMTAIECVQLLIDRVGFEQANAEGEVRRSFNGSYPPIYQCAYMLGALQFYALHKELVDSGQMSNREFHDALYREGNIPVEMLRLGINGQKVTREYQTSWKFYSSLV